MQVQTDPRPTILIAEPTPEVGGLLLVLLTQEGYAPTVAPSLEQALQLVADQTFALVLTDSFAPAGQPFDLSEARRLLERCQPTPVGLITGWPVDPEEVRRQGFAFLATKPFDLELLLAELAKRLR